MTIGFPLRAVVSCTAVCATGVLALVPAASARPGIDPDAPKATSTPSRGPSLHGSGTKVRLEPGGPKVPGDVSALSWLVADADTGEVLAAHNAHRRMPPASTLKTLFALTVLPSLPAGTRHTVKRAELKGVGEGSSLVGVKENHSYRVADLWRGVFLSSGNDAVHVLASLNGGWRATTEQMQAKAKALGALDTKVVSPDGYDAPGQVSSAYDLAVFGRAGLRNKEFAEYCATKTAKFPVGKWSFGIQNTNRLLTGANGVRRYPGLIGVKNGYTSKAGNTLIAAARRDGRTLVVTVMNPQSGAGFAVYEETRSLLDWGFRAVGKVKAVGSLLPPAPPATQAGPEQPPAVAVAKAEAVPGWSEAGMVAGAAGFGAGAMALTLRLAVGRFAKDEASDGPTG
jgi:D-alanyl-D-alanine carboxypeptidase (penicillin-binding protein 5/6)